MSTIKVSKKIFSPYAATYDNKEDSYSSKWKSQFLIRNIVLVTHSEMNTDKLAFQLFKWYLSNKEKYGPK